MNNNVRLGIITTPEGKATFEDVLREFGGVEGRLITYQNDGEIREIIEENQDDTDVILFGGPLSYEANRKYVREDMPTLSIDYRETELLSGLLQLARNQLLPGEGSGLSLDTFAEELVQEVLAQSGMPDLKTFVKPFHAAERPEAIVGFHADLWKSGRIGHVITCRRSVYNGLAMLGIPATKLLPTKFNIRNSISKAILLGENSKNANFQIAIGHFQVVPNEGGQAVPDYALEKISLDFHRGLIDIAQRVNASILPLGGFEFLLYTNRGFLEEITRMWKETTLFQDMEKKLSADIYAGFGAGKTAMAAQAHAKSALERAKGQGGGCAYIVRDDGKIIGPLGRSHTLEYTHKTENPALLRMVSKTQLSTDTVAKVLSYSRIHGEFTAEEMANALGVTTRNIRNIFKKLADSGFLAEKGMERPYPKGRPRKIFTLLPNDAE
ncbi:hypothetical protein ACF3MZ_16775 [Paenibacillaceae bacterium WGS1546]|uniref:hypothetical protein n=1 Tax=Cohnella sp. WGS1546 TaxID=3366810 RepID=UPI00372D0F7E